MVPTVAVGRPGDAGAAGVGVAAGVAARAEQGEPGGRQGLSWVGSAPLVHGAPAGPTTFPPRVGALKGTALVPARAAFMNFCQMDAGSVPPVISIPWTPVIWGVLPVVGSVV